MEIDENTNDGFHSFKELYEHRHALFITLMKSHPEISWRSWSPYEDGSPMPGWFLAGMDLPTGSISYHMPIEPYWAMLDDTPTHITTYLLGCPKWDGHTPADVVDRLLRWLP